MEAANKQLVPAPQRQSAAHHSPSVPAPIERERNVRGPGMKIIR